MNDEREHTRGIVRRGPVWIVVQVLGSLTALGFAVVTTSGWLGYLEELRRIQKTGGINTDDPAAGYVVFGFMVWFIPLLIVVGAILIAFGWRSLLGKIVTIAATVLAIGTIAATVVVA